MKPWTLAGIVGFAALGISTFAFAENRPEEVLAPVSQASEGLEKATFAGGCFWCMEAPFDNLEGVVSTTSGYAGGDEPNPTYKSVSAGRTGHAEVVQVVYDPRRVQYSDLLHVYWRNVDPLTANRQFCDRGRHYRTAILTHDAEQRRLALDSKRALEAEGRFDRPIVTEIAEVRSFTAAEDYHQDYYKKNPIRYRYYRGGCGRDARLGELWGDEAGGGASSAKHESGTHDAADTRHR